MDCFDLIIDFTSRRGRREFYSWSDFLRGKIRPNSHLSAERKM